MISPAHLCGMVGQGVLETETMMKSTEACSTAEDARVQGAAMRDIVAHPRSGRAPYAPPALERLGEWSALTLQQSIPIFP